MTKLLLPEEVEHAQMAKQLPKPSGYRILCGVPEIDKAFDSGLLKADMTIHHEELLTTVLFVLELGPDCYQDKDKFPSGPWCKKGDFVLVRPHSGTRVKVYGSELRIVNDDSIEGVVADPRGYKRA